MSHLRTHAASLIGVTAACSFVFLVLELSSRLIHAGARPALPFRRTPDGHPRMAAGLDIRVRLPDHPVARYVTDDLGARVMDPEARAEAAAGGVLVAGDSQALGWGMDFDYSFASRVADMVTGDPRRAAVLGSAATDPELYLDWVRAYTARHPEPLQLAVLTLNLGNDLDEMFTGRGGQFTASPLAEWFAAHSFLFLDALVVSTRLASNEVIPPDANPILHALPIEPMHTFDVAVARVMAECSQALPPTKQVVVLLVPNDYQVDPREIDKYQPTYRNPELFQQVKKRVPESRARLDWVAADLSAALRIEALRVVDPTAALRAHGPSPALFDRHSHHLTIEGQQVVAQVLADALRGAR